MSLNNDDETNPALTIEGEVSWVDKGFIGLEKICNEMEKVHSVLKEVIPPLKMMEMEDSTVLNVMEQAESMLNVAIFFLKLLLKQDSTVLKVIISLIILIYIMSNVIPVLGYFI